MLTFLQSNSCKDLTNRFLSELWGFVGGHTLNSGQRRAFLQSLCKARLVLRQEHTGPTVGLLKHLERLGRGREQICLVCSAALDAFGAARTLSAPIQHVKSEEEGCRPSEPLDTLTGGVLANQCGVWEGYCVRIGFLHTPLCHFLFSCFAVLA